MRIAWGSIVGWGMVAALLWAGHAGAQGLPGCLAQLGVCTTSLGKCQKDLAVCEAEPTVIFPGDGVDGPTLRYTDNGDGTFTDNNTLLMWEKKVPGSGCLHCVGDAYRFPGQTPQEQTVTAFLAAINTEGGVGLGGHSDWRIPNPKELQSLVDYSRKIPASSVPGSTGDLYLTSRFLQDDPSHGWVVNFVFGSVIALDVNGFAYLVRAVRGGR